MKKQLKGIIIVAIIILVLISAGISFFLIRDAMAEVPDDLWFITHEGEEYKFGDADKKVKLVEFMYGNCPDICPTTTHRMTQLKKELIDEGVFGDKVQFLTITIDLYDDTPQALTHYMEGFNIENDGNWIFLTGDKDRMEESHENLKEITDMFHFQYRDPGNGYYIHSSFSYLIDENNRFIKKFGMGEDFDKDEVFETIMKEI